MSKPLTATTRRALEIVRDNPEIRPRQFATLLWPDHPGHRRIGKCGAYGSTRGVGMRLSAGGYLAKLYRKGFLDYCPNRYGPVYSISTAGRAALQK